MKNKNQSGMTLLEVIVAMAIGSIILLAIAKSYPILTKQIMELYQRYRLGYFIKQTLHIIEKDIRRAGYCQHYCDGKPIVISNKSDESEDSCLIIAYDLNTNNQWEPPEHSESEFFGYRLSNKSVEWKRGAGNCQESGWERLFDPNEIVVDSFKAEKLPAKDGLVFIKLTLIAHWFKHPSINYQYQSVIRLRNIRG
ncbi:peptidase [Photorhabdus luminescens]|uniref:Peptidase n=1 Tax=Photorhabdus akhurstii TaxID=171438 RepID=A0ABX8LPV3_9GAMM|nr:prepilin peptidase-dependent protein [Photorhabdus akhurstii]QXF32351.1 peptidase [Photorhabdus akhurstii]UJD74144.1 peptidase [Photorhabdus luminescens]